MDRDDFAMIAEGLDRILTDAPLDAIDKAGGLGPEADALWQTLEESGYILLCASEGHGGSGAALADILPLAALAARHAAAAPLADTILATGLLSAAGQQPPALRIGLIDPLAPDAPIAHASQIDALLSLEDGRLRLMRIESGDIQPVDQGEDGAGRLSRRSADVLVDCAAPEWLTPDAFRALAALIRASQMAGAMEAVLGLSLDYTRDREQFGRPLAKFQAIQHHLSDIACETAAAMAAVEMAGDALCADAKVGPRVIDEIAIAKTRCGEAASRVAAAAHQAHGAMGFTREYALGRYTRRLWQWQDEFGSETEWAELLGKAVLADNEPRLWPRISQPI